MRNMNIGKNNFIDNILIVNMNIYYIMYYINLLVLIIILLNNSIKYPEKKKCKWNVFYDNSYDTNRSNIIYNYIKFINKLDIVYYLGWGSELGALRNGGLIKNDHDVDIIIPVWLNYKIFKCNQHIEFFPNKCKIITDIKTKICNKTKYEYMIIFKKYVESITKKRMYYECKNWGKYGYINCYMLKTDLFFLDIWIILGNELYDQNINICKCKFSSYSSYCTENALKNAKKLYGEKWFIPIKSGNGNGDERCSLSLYPNKNNSKIINTFIS